MENNRNGNELGGSWEQMKDKVKEKWGKLTNSDMTEINGDRKQLATRLRTHYGYDNDQAEREVGSFIKSCNSENSCCSTSNQSRA